MANRYKCSKCNGTFDVAVHAPAPPCTFPGARKGKMELQASDAGGAPTGCLDAEANANQGAAKDAFMLRTFTIPHFVPATRYGNFDCTYRPAEGLLHITVHVCIEWAAKKRDYWFDDRWGEKEKLAFQQECQDAVDRYWTCGCIFQCSRQGWTDVTAMPTFKLKFTANRSEANYYLTAEKDFVPYEDENPMKAKCNAGIVPQQILKNDLDITTTGFFQAFSLRTLNLPIKATATVNSEEQRIKKVLQDATHKPAEIRFAAGTDTFGAKTSDVLRFLATRLKPPPPGRSWTPDYQIPGTPLIPLLITGKGATKDLAERRVNQVVKDLDFRGVKNPIKPGTPPFVVAPGAASGEEVGVTLALDPTFALAEGVLKDVPFYGYNTFAHEFGHMIGLPDEYQNEGGEDESTNAKLFLQRSFERLAATARVTLPPWGKMTASMMSAGTTMMPQHFLTAWNALCALTDGIIRPDEWKIHLKA